MILFKSVISLEDNKCLQIEEIDMAPCSSKTIFDSDHLLDMEHPDGCEMVCGNLENHDLISKFVVSLDDNTSPQIGEIDMAGCSSTTIFNSDDLVDNDMDTDDLDKDSNWCPEDDGSHRLTRIIQQISHDAISQEDEVINYQLSESSRSEESGNEERTTETVNRKRTKGVRKREEEKRKKQLGLSYKNRKGISFPSEEFTPIQQCCKKKCFEKCPPEQQNIIWSNYWQKSPEISKQVLCERMTCVKCKYHAKGRGTKGGKDHDRDISVVYSIQLGTEKILVCKKFFSIVHGLTYNQVNLLISKMKASGDGYIQADSRGKHVPPNKLIEERKVIRDFIERYPRHESHYARRDNPNKIFLPSYLTIRQMHIEYKAERSRNGFVKSAGYNVFRNVFKQTGYTFKQPYIDTCRKCDEYKTLKKSANSETEKQEIDQLHEEHVKEANEAYECKRKDKHLAIQDESKRVLVFDLQQVLPAPFLTTNIVYYKRLLSVFNLTVRDCCSTESSFCFMWHEVIGGRGSDQIASCIHKKLLDLPDTIRHVTTYARRDN